MFKISSPLDRMTLKFGGSLDRKKSQTNLTKDTAANIVFIDTRVDNFQSLLSGLKPNTEAVILDPSQDGITQITEFLQARTGVESVQILSHGSAGNLQIGSTQLNADNLGQYQESLQQWFSPQLGQRPDLLIYGCDVASGVQGDQFINKLSQMTGADVAASVDLTGGASKGGNWILEKATGIIEAGQAFTQKVQDVYQEVLNTRPTNPNDEIFNPSSGSNVATASATSATSSSSSFASSTTSSSTASSSSSSSSAFSSSSFSGRSSSFTETSSSSFTSTSFRSQQTSFQSQGSSFFAVGNSINPAPGLNPAFVPKKTLQGSLARGIFVSRLIGDAASATTTSAGVQGIAITNLSNDEGTWQYSLDDGAKWINIGAVSASNALLLDVKSKMRFVPNIDNISLKGFSNRSFFDKKVSFCGWDQTSGTTGSFANVNLSSSSGAFGSQLANISIVVNPSSLTPLATEVAGAGSILSELLALVSTSTTTSTSTSSTSTSTTTSSSSGSSSSGSSSSDSGSSSSGSGSSSSDSTSSQSGDEKDKKDKEKDKKDKDDKDDDKGKSKDKDKKDKDDKDDDKDNGKDKDKDKKDKYDDKKDKKDKDDDDDLLGNIKYDDADDRGKNLTGDDSSPLGFVFMSSGFSRSSRSSSSSFESTTSTTSTTTSTTSDLSIRLQKPNIVIESIQGTSIRGVLSATATANTIYGGSSSETLFGFAGSRNNLLGGEGDDLIFGVGGRDFIRGGDDNDIIYGGKGRDVIFGEQGNDIIFGGKGNDSLSGGAGTDVIYGQKGDDLISGGTGNDRLFGGDGKDTLNGNEGNDLLFGGKGDDNLNGDAGDDLLVGGTGNDVLTGGAGKDRFRLAPREGTDIIADFTVGEDSIELARGIQFIDLQITQGIGATVVGLKPQSLFRSEKPLALLVGVDADSLTASSFTLLT